MLRVLCANSSCLPVQDFLSKVPENRTADLLREVLVHTQNMLMEVEDAPLPSEEDISKQEAANVARCVELLAEIQITGKRQRKRRRRRHRKRGRKEEERRSKRWMVERKAFNDAEASMA